MSRPAASPDPGEELPQAEREPEENPLTHSSDPGQPAFNRCGNRDYDLMSTAIVQERQPKGSNHSGAIIPDLFLIPAWVGDIPN
jgi:hypothetical protein